MRKSALALVILVGCSNDQVTSSNQIFGNWDRVLTDSSLTIARKVTLASDLTFTLTFDDASAAAGTWEVNNLYLLLYPVSPAHTTWCTPNVNRSGGTLKLDVFSSDCDTSPHPPGIQSPLVGDYRLEP